MILVGLERILVAATVAAVFGAAEFLNDGVVLRESGSALGQMNGVRVHGGICKRERERGNGESGSLGEGELPAAYHPAWA